LEQEGQDIQQFEQLLRDKMSEFGGEDHEHDGQPRGIIGQIMEHLRESFAGGDFTIGDAAAYAKEIFGSDEAVAQGITSENVQGFIDMLQ